MVFRRASGRLRSWRDLAFLSVAVAVLSGTVSSIRGQGLAAIRGFSPPRVAAERELEQKLKRIPDAASAERHLRWLTSAPHMAGTDASRRVAEYLRDQLRSYGFEADLVTYRVWLPLPAEVKLELVEPEKKSLATPEEPYEVDKDTSDRRAVAGFSGYSPSGEVTAPVVYVNYGLPEDYRRLAELGVSVAGKIALARYGNSYRGVKARVAEGNKAAGLVIYSDPADDGYVAGDPYPRGPWRPMSGIQRGSILYIFQYPGDPLTPGVASTGEAQRIDPRQAQSLPRVLTLPVSPRDGAEILRRLEGPRVPREWQGGLPFTYHVGPGPAVARIRLAMDYQQRAIYDVVGKLRGETDDEWVVVGNHHDAWVFGAVDPGSGTSVALETARALGELARAGWKPRRTILFCYWDAEEYGLLGSTEWVEEHAAELARKAVAYINLDAAVSGGTFGGSGTPSLRELVREVAREVADPRTGRSVYEVWKERVERGQGRRPVTPGSEPVAVAAAGEVPLGALGSGSDFTAFLHHVGIPSLDVGFGGEYGVYHALYDNFYWMKTFGDPSFTYHAAMARIVGILVLRLAGSDLLPFDYQAYAADIERHIAELDSLARAAWDGGGPETVSLVRPDGLGASAMGQGKLDLTAVREAAAAFTTAAARAQQALAVAPGDSRPESLTAVNRKLVEVEQALLAPQGLAGRPWYRHTIYAPGTYTGYDAVPLPGVREALDRKDWETARREAASLAEALRRAAARLDAISAPSPPETAP